MQTEWVLRGSEILIGLFYFGFGIANARSSGPIIESLIIRLLPLPQLLFWAGVATQSIAGLLLMLGYQAALAAAVLIPFTLIASIVFHAFWSMEDEARVLNRIIFICNYTCVLASLLMLACLEPGIWTLLPR
jgi:putative oxidoreductase